MLLEEAMGMVIDAAARHGLEKPHQLDQTGGPQAGQFGQMQTGVKPKGFRRSRQFRHGVTSF